MTTAQRDAIENPANSLLIFNTETGFVSVNLGSPSVPAWVNLTLNTGLSYDPETQNTNKGSGQLSVHNVTKSFDTETEIGINLNESTSFTIELNYPADDVTINLTNAVPGTPYLISLQQQQIVQNVTFRINNVLTVVWENRETHDFSENPQFSESLVSLFFTGQKLVGSVVMNHSATIYE